MDKITGVTKQLDGLLLEDITPPWAKILIQCMSQLVDAVKDFNALSDRVKKLEDINAVRDRVVETLQNENKELKAKILSARQVADNNEQKSRTQCLLIHGIEESDEENTDQICLSVIAKDVGVDISIGDIARSHRTGPKKSQTTRRTKPRPIIVRFTCIRKRMEVFYNKKNLRGNKAVITESLTAMRLELLNKAKTKYGYRNVWTSEGRIFTKCDNKLIHISSDADME